MKKKLFDLSKASTLCKSRCLFSLQTSFCLRGLTLRKKSFTVKRENKDEKLFVSILKILHSHFTHSFVLRVKCKNSKSIKSKFVFQKLLLKLKVFSYLWYAKIHLTSKLSFKTQIKLEVNTFFLLGWHYLHGLPFVFSRKKALKCLKN